MINEKDHEERQDCYSHSTLGNIYIIFIFFILVLELHVSITVSCGRDLK